MTPEQSCREAFVEASSFLEKCGVYEPHNNARLLLEHVLGVYDARYYMMQPEPFPGELRSRWEDAVTRKAAGEPAQYIIGSQEFYGLPFEVTPAVLIPRPETELLVEAVLRAADRVFAGGGEAVRAVDIGTGSGAIAVTMASLRPQWQVAAGDLSADALQVAARNAVANGVQIDFREGDLLAPFVGERLDILVSNPPYIPAGDIAGLQQEVRDHEPRLALDGGPDGLAPYRIMLEQLRLLPAPPQVIGFELGMGQARDVAALLESAGHWPEIIIVPDLAGIERHVLGVRLSEQMTKM
ncbi:peptide chain release factor N(5)-glutamine methyltransferase [Paenibacillus silvae]|uniref:peptide chain release factor N(5)-glutamine methyltransferase n=1 Tax=Paenibacillus silvae TaxID=1325358 RepID=UPI0020038AB3|nr:peptide chain release factor N(5)-glutamine methyltransferase [Paenibacillus silvae]MCK6075738.1 peptide chain release factor N(5)-glutamine methyltransferase [Paenibacillus silvae]MCK6150126.1 peptide chain release factor N(5)-glutamine methyltransferase [Paenibacillus silvae]MCK6268424.1 peptide chain release factor N(5)-glutamine methyltransferase [Paenibacillus silvae]